MKQQLLQAYKEKLFADADLMTGEEKNKSEFAKAFLTQGRPGRDCGQVSRPGSRGGHRLNGDLQR